MQYLFTGNYETSFQKIKDLKKCHVPRLEDRIFKGCRVKKSPLHEMGISEGEEKYEAVMTEN